MSGLRVLLTCTSFVLALGPGNAMALSTHESDESWIWPGAYRSMVDDVNGGAVIALQRHFDDPSKSERRGPSPWPWKVKELTVAFRFSSRPIAELVKNEFLILRQQWIKHGVHVVGLQLDFDSPTGKLHDYVAEIHKLQKMIQRETPGQKLSVTGLTDWLTLEHLGFNKNITVYFQLYQGTTEHRHGDMHIGRLAKVQFPFKIGLLPNQSLTYEQKTKLESSLFFGGYAKFYGGQKL